MDEQGRNIAKFLECFSKKELIEAFSQTYDRRWAAMTCTKMFKQKGDKLISDMEKNLEEHNHCLTMGEFLKKQDEYSKLDKEIERLQERFYKISW